MPLPTPTGGPRLGRVRLQAAALGSDPIATLAAPLTAAAWTAANPVLAANTMGIESDTLLFKVGDGSSLWAALAHIGSVVDLPVAPGPVLGHEAQTAASIAQMSLGGVLQRVASKDPSGAVIAADAWDLNQAAYWAFQPAADSIPGASGEFLDWWGRMLQVPRLAGELDTSYCQRIPATVMSAGITNKGMALLIDQMLGFPTFTGGVFTGTEVLDAAEYFATSNLRANDLHRANDGLRAAPAAAYSVTSTWNCFLVVLPAAIPAGFTAAQIDALVDRVRAGGNRKIATIIPSTGTTIPTAPAAPTMPHTPPRFLG